MLPGLLVCCIALLTLFPRAVCALTPKQPEPAGTGLPLWRGPSPVTVPFEYFDQHIYVTVTINGKPGYIFMFDSGSNRNVLNLRTARALGLDPGNVLQARGIGYGGSAIYTAPEQQISAAILGVPVASRVAVLDMSAYERHFGHPLDGILGYPFLQHFIVQVDFEHKLLSMIPAQARLRIGMDVSVPLTSSDNFAVIPVSVADVGFVKRTFKAAIDTGSNGSLLIFDPFVHQLNLRDSRNRSEPALCFGINGYFPVNAGTVGEFVVGDAKAHNMPVNYLAREQEVGPERSLAGAIGNGMLQNFKKVTFDVPHHRMLFTLKPPPVTAANVVRYTAAP